MKLRYKLVISAFLLTLFGSLVWSANHYHNKAIEYKKQRDENAMALDSAMATISDMQKRQRDVAELDARYTKELVDANATIESLCADVSAGRKWLHVKAVCPDKDKTTAASGVDDASSPRLTDTAQRDYFVLRERIETITNQLNGLQEYVRSQCSY